MSASLLTFSIILYILSLVFSLLIFLINKTERKNLLRTLIILHSGAFLFLIFLKGEMRSYASLLFFCSGIILAGLSYQSLLYKPIKIYFAIFILSFLFFIYSPSRLINFITLNFNQVGEKEFKLKDNLYLMKQQGMLMNDIGPKKYKIFKKLGMFNRTLARNLDFKIKVDSARWISSSGDSVIAVRAYEFYENGIKDSSEISISLGMNGDKDVFLKHSK